MKIGSLIDGLTENKQQLKEQRERCVGDIKLSDVSEIFVPKSNDKNLSDIQKYDGTLSLRRHWINSLRGCPQEIDGDFDISENNLKSLEFGPKIVNGDYYCVVSKLVSLNGAPRKVKTFSAVGNKLKTLDGIPKEIDGDCFLSNNKLTNLHNIHHLVETINGKLELLGNPIESHVLGLLKIKKLKNVKFSLLNANSTTSKRIFRLVQLGKIINKYLPLGDIFACQEELIEAGLDEFAQL
jgi:hypothetical protein